ncbi:hypothetical protein AMJ80_10320 [bacterium SM23_31]|nr:MAG: hypothetical protein AMJ80_10320 [bacterium SM23_31]
MPVVYGQKTRQEKLEEYFQKGIELREKGDIEGAIEAFLYVTARDHGNAEAYYQLGLAYMDFPRGRNMKKAEDALWQARRITHGTRELHALGDFYEKKVFDSVARIMFKWIVKEDSTDVRALTKLSDYYFEQGLNENWDKRYDINDYLLFDGNSVKHILEEGKPSLPLREMTKYVEKGAEMNDRILAVESDNRTALYRKATGYLEMNDFDSFINLFEQRLEKDREDYNTYLFLGLGYAELGEYETANAYFQKALYLMGSDERISFESFLYLKPEFRLSFRRYGLSLLGYRESFKPERSEMFWDIRDPLHLTSYNERRLEHYGRIAEANLRFSEPSEGIDGWKTIRGYLWIYFGKPIRIKKFFETVIPPMITQKWEYEDFSFTIIQYFEGSKKVWHISQRIISPLINKYPNYYRYKPHGEIFEFPLDVVCFKGNDGKTEVNFFYTVPADKIRWESWFNTFSGKLRHGVFVFDNELYRVQENVNTSYFSVDVQASGDDLSKYYVLSNSVELEPDVYTICVEAMDEKSGNVGIKRMDGEVEKFVQDTLLVSDILVARDAVVTNINEPVSRDNISFAANPFHSFDKKYPISIYYEVYNLFIVDIEQHNHYRMEYMIGPAPEEESIAKRLIKSLIWRGSQEEGISVSSEYRGVGRTDNQLLTIEHSITKPGEYLLTVRITDLISGMTAERTTPIWIY